MALSKAARTAVARAYSRGAERARSSGTIETLAEAGGAFAGGALFGEVSFLGGALPANYAIAAAAVGLELLGGRRLRGNRLVSGVMSVAKGMGYGQLGIEGRRVTGGDFLGLGGG